METAPTDHRTAYAWALVAPTATGLGEMIYGSRQGHPEAVRTGGPMVTTLNLLHVATPDALNLGMSMRMTTFSIVSLLTMFLIRYLCHRRKMPELFGWKT